VTAHGTQITITSVILWELQIVSNTKLSNTSIYTGCGIKKTTWANVQAIDDRFSQDLTHQESLKSVNF